MRVRDDAFDSVNHHGYHHSLALRVDHNAAPDDYQEGAGSDNNDATRYHDHSPADYDDKGDHDDKADDDDDAATDDYDRPPNDHDIATGPDDLRAAGDVANRAGTDALAPPGHRAE